MKVFIVDDDPGFAEGVALTLEIEGHVDTCLVKPVGANEILQAIKALV